MTVPCPDCGGDGCKKCDGKGTIWVDLGPVLGRR